MTPRGSTAVTGLELMTALHPPTRASEPDATGRRHSEHNPGSLVGEVTVTASREPSADDKVLAVVKEHDDPLGLEVNYLHKDQIGEAAGLEGSTLNNALSKLTKADKIHRQKKDGKEVRGMYGFGSEPIID